ncbi:hypothetical protein ACSS6W_003426 [Trichoderma asperelloides]
MMSSRCKSVNTSRFAVSSPSCDQHPLPLTAPFIPGDHLYRSVTLNGSVVDFVTSVLHGVFSPPSCRLRLVASVFLLQYSSSSTDCHDGQMDT